jgi:hypothetical protein
LRLRTNSIDGFIFFSSGISLYSCLRRVMNLRILQKGLQDRVDLIMFKDQHRKVWL